MLLVSTCIILANTQVLLYVTLKVLIYGISRRRTNNGTIAGGGKDVMKIAAADGDYYDQASATWKPVAPNLGPWIQPENWPIYSYRYLGFKFPSNTLLKAAPWFVEYLENCFLSERGYSDEGMSGWYDPDDGGYILQLSLYSTQNGDNTYWAMHKKTGWLYYETNQGGLGARTQTGNLLPLVLLPKEDYIVDASGNIISKK